MAAGIYIFVERSWLAGAVAFVLSIAGIDHAASHRFGNHNTPQTLLDWLFRRGPGPPA